MNVNQQIECTLEKNKEVWKQSTYYKYKQIYETYIYDYFKHVDHDSLDEKMVYQFFNQIQVSNSTKVIIKRVLSFGLAQDTNIHYKIERVQEDIDILSTKEQEQLESFLLGHLSLINVCILLCLYTGLRLGEVCALKWEDINLTQQYLTITKTIQRIPTNSSKPKTKVVFSSPKTMQSRRKVPIPKRIVELLKEYYIQDSFYLISNKLKPMEPRGYQYHFKQILKQANLRNINFHALRHTFATRCIENDIDIKTVSEILGHSDITITINYYVKSTFEFKLEQIEKLAKTMK